MEQDQRRQRESQRTFELLADSQRAADRADREVIRKMTPSQRFNLALDLSEFMARNAGVARKR